MDIRTANRGRHETLAGREEAMVKDRPRGAPLRRKPAPDSQPLSTGMLRDAAREAGLFQRSVLGHLDHQDWINRVRADGQRLMNLLRDMGFTPADERQDGLPELRQ